MDYDFPYIGNVIIPTDELIFHVFQRGRYTTNQIWLLWLMWFNQCHYYHPWLGMVNIAPIRMVMTGGWFMIVLTTLIQEQNMSRWFFTNQYFMYFMEGFWTLLCSIWCAFEVSPVTFCWFTCGVQHGTHGTWNTSPLSWSFKMPRNVPKSIHGNT